MQNDQKVQRLLVLVQFYLTLDKLFACQGISAYGVYYVVPDLDSSVGLVSLVQAKALSARGMQNYQEPQTIAASVPEMV
jgi:hypothetical protein